MVWFIYYIVNSFTIYFTITIINIPLLLITCLILLSETNIRSSIEVSSNLISSDLLISLIFSNMFFTN